MEGAPRLDLLEVPRARVRLVCDATGIALEGAAETFPALQLARLSSVQAMKCAREHDADGQVKGKGGGRRLFPRTTSILVLASGRMIEQRSSAMAWKDGGKRQALYDTQDKALLRSGVLLALKEAPYVRRSSFVVVVGCRERVLNRGSGVESFE